MSVRTIMLVVSALVLIGGLAVVAYEAGVFVGSDCGDC